MHESGPEERTGPCWRGAAAFVGVASVGGEPAPDQRAAARRTQAGAGRGPRDAVARPLIALPDGTVIAGNKRLRAAPEARLGDDPGRHGRPRPDRARLWALRDNNAYGEWDEPALAEILAELAGRRRRSCAGGVRQRDLDRILAGIAPHGRPRRRAAVAAGAASRGRARCTSSARTACCAATRPTRQCRPAARRRAAGDGVDGPALRRRLRRQDHAGAYDRKRRRASGTACSRRALNARLTRSLRRRRRSMSARRAGRSAPASGSRSTRRAGGCTRRWCG